MTLLSVSAVLVTLAALFAYLNHRFLRLPTTIGIMAIALVLSLVLVALGKLGLHFDSEARRLLEKVDFDNTLMNGMLCFLLFAGSLHVNLDDLSRQKWVVTFLATAGVVLSTLLVGFVSYWGFAAIGQPLPLAATMLFGALISPTDPIAVMGILKSAGLSRDLEVTIVGESLLNDGVAVVVFLILGAIVGGGVEVTAGSVVLLFLREALGGALLGLGLGWVTYRMLRSVDEYTVEILLTLALVMGGYALARLLDLSGPIAVVFAGLFIGNHGRRFAMSQRTREHLDTFWALVDEILNAVLFVLIGLEVLLLRFPLGYLLAAAFSIVVVLAARLAVVSASVTLAVMHLELARRAIAILTWGGLRGGISVALALSLPRGPVRETLVPVTYCVVVFSILVQGLTVGPLTRYRSRRTRPAS